MADAKYGKKYEHLVETSEKYAGYFYNILYAILADISIIIKSLGEQSKNDDKDAKLLLRRISNIKFLVLLSGMIDAYDVIAKLCGILQKVNLFIWERKEMVLSYLEKMKVMVNELHYSTTIRKSRHTINKYWPLLETNELTEGHLEGEEADNYEMRSCRVPADDSPAPANPFDKTRKEL